MSLFDFDTEDELDPSSNDHRLTLRIPQWLLDRIDEERKKRVVLVSRNLWILEFIAIRLKKKK